MKRFWMILLLSSQMGLRAAGHTVWVTNARELDNAVKTARPGDEIVLRDGVWENVRMEFTSMGTAEQPIRIRAAHSGLVIVSGASSLRIGGDYLVIEGLNFVNGASPSGSVWEFRAGDRVANNCRITNSQIRDFSPPNRMKENYWVALYGKNNRVDHCRFLNKTNLGVLMAVILTDDRSRLNDHRVDSNYFGRRQPLGSNGGEIIRIGVSEHCTFYSNTVISNNLFEYCDGETEIVSVKSCGNRVLNNVFKECQGAVVLRHGNNNTVQGNVFWGNGKEGTGGVRVINEGNWVVNNYFYKLRGEGFRSPLAIMNGVPNSPPHRYLPVRDAVVAHNTFSQCVPFALGEGNDQERSVAPDNVFFFNNLIWSDTATTLCYVFSETNGYRFAGNVTGNQYKTPSLPGFEKRKLQLGIWTSPVLTVSPNLGYDKVLPPSMAQQADSRLGKGFPKNIGSDNLGQFKKLFDQSRQWGIRWKEQVPISPEATPALVSCKDAQAVYACLRSAKTACRIVLTGSEYVFDKPLLIKTPVYLQGGQAILRFRSEEVLESLFIVEGNNALELNNLKADLGGLQVRNLIAAAKDSSAVHYRLKISGSSFSHLQADAFFAAPRYSYADDITVSQCVFSNNKASLFSLKDELDNKGYYNVEKITLSQNKFSNHQGEILSLYRGGNDESTMGPKLVFTHNSVVDCTNSGALIRLHGVQYSTLRNNAFRNANPGAVVVSYIDVVKAFHYLGKNTLENSGRMETNQYLINLK